jgi:23S rRNA pseudouridine1911/1915/1917 synthase
MAIQAEFKLIIEPDAASDRLDAYLARHLPDCTRSFAATLIRKGHVKVDGGIQKPGYRVRPLQQITGILPPPAPIDLAPEPIALDIVYQDTDVIVINKPAGLVVHPSAGHASGTLVNALLFHCPGLEGIGGEQRPGIVHRLDKDTSGLMVVAKNDTAQRSLSSQFKQREIDKLYWALVEGRPAASDGRIEMCIGRNPMDRKKMSTKAPAGRTALTLWTVREHFPAATLLAVDLKTGRTHQVRVHCQAMGHPVVGDPVYGRRRNKRPSGTSTDAAAHRLLQSVKRQMLHARRLTFTHPQSAERLSFVAPLPEDMERLLEGLRALG